MAIAIAGLMIVATSSSAIHVQPEEQTVGTPKIISSMDMTVSTITGAVPVVKKQTDASSRGTDFLVHHDIDEEDCENPALVTDSSLSNILVMTEIYEDIGHIAMWGRASTDSGVTWGDDIYGWEQIPEGDPDDVSVPKLDYYGSDSMAYGTWTAGGSYHAQTYYVELPDMTDPNVGTGWLYYFVDWGSHDFSDFDSADVAGFPYDVAVSPSEGFWGLIAGTGDKPEPNGEDDTMWFSYFLPGDQVTIISFYNMEDDAEKMACDIDISIGQPYLVYEYTMEADPSDTGSSFTKTPPLRPDDYAGEDYWWDGTFSGFNFEDVFNPDIAAAGGSVYVVAENADGNIVCYYSSDAGDSFMESTVSADAAVEAFPQVAIAGSNVICTYTRGGDIFSKVSKDGGVTWVDETQINDPAGTAVAQYGCAGIDGPYGSWTDNRNAPPTEIYFDVTIDLGNPPTAPVIDGETNGDVGTQYTYGFTSTDPDGDMIAEYIVNWGDGTPEETIVGPFNSGERAEGDHTYQTGGTFTITAIAKDENGAVGPAGTLDVTMPRGIISINTMFLRFLENFPHAFPLLRHLLGL